MFVNLQISEASALESEINDTQVLLKLLAALTLPTEFINTWFYFIHSGIDMEELVASPWVLTQICAGGRVV